MIFVTVLNYIFLFTGAISLIVGLCVLFPLWGILNVKEKITHFTEKEKHTDSYKGLFYSGALCALYGFSFVFFVALNQLL